jgi:hypothetical protein
MKMVNCTPHAITVRPDGSDGVTIPPSGIVPRVAVSAVADGEICERCPVETPAGVFSEVFHLPVMRTAFGRVEGLPDAEDGVWLIVSSVVLSALGGSRPDCVAPDTSPASAIRDDGGRIIAVRRLTR